MRIRTPFLKKKFPEAKEIFREIFCTERRYCRNCRNYFFCTGECPPNRWRTISKEERKLHLKACFCKECLIDSRLGKDYKKDRLEVCYFRSKGEKE